MYLKPLTNYAFNSISNSLTSNNHKKLGGTPSTDITFLLYALLLYLALGYCMILIWNNQGRRFLALPPIEENIWGIWDLLCLSLLGKFITN